MFFPCIGSRFLSDHKYPNVLRLVTKSYAISFSLAPLLSPFEPALPPLRSSFVAADGSFATLPTNSLKLTASLGASFFANSSAVFPIGGGVVLTLVWCWFPCLQKDFCRTCCRRRRLFMAGPLDLLKSAACASPTSKLPGFFGTCHEASPPLRSSHPFFFSREFDLIILGTPFGLNCFPPPPYSLS